MGGYALPEATFATVASSHTRANGGLFEPAERTPCFTSSGNASVPAVSAADLVFDALDEGRR